MPPKEASISFAASFPAATAWRREGWLKSLHRQIVFLQALGEAVSEKSCLIPAGRNDVSGFSPIALIAASKDIVKSEPSPAMVLVVPTRQVRQAEYVGR